MSLSSLPKVALAGLLCLTLAGCKSDAERADEYFQSGMQLLEAGDVDRAFVEFRNVFEFDQNHFETRMAMGIYHLEQNNPGAAYGQFLRVAEQYPDTFDARIILAELAFVANNWEEFTRHGTAVVEMRPEEPRVQAVDLGMTYRNAVLADDSPGWQATVTPAEALLADMPENQILNQLLVDAYVRDGAINKALTRFDALLALDPDNRQLNIRRLTLLAQLQDVDAMEMQLREMVERFPSDQEIQSMLFRFYVSQQRMDEAEAFLREISDPADQEPGLYLSLINFVSQTRGEEAARVEIERAVAENPKPNRFRAMLAMMDFQAGEQEAAIAEMETILEDSDQTDPEEQAISTTLARMLVQTGNQVGARRLVEETLAQNSSNVEALKMQASWQLRADEVDEALANLRVALDAAPEDIQVMNLMYEAYVRLGDTNLARDYLALAVDVSGNSPETSLRYARLLIGEERYLPAEDVLLPALRQSPNNVELLALLGQIYLRMDDVPRAQQVIDTLNRIATQQSTGIANGLQAEVLSREGGADEALKFLEDLANSGAAGIGEQFTLLRVQLQVGETEAALKIAQDLVDENPGNPAFMQVLAATQLASGDAVAAEVSYRAVVDAAPAQASNAWLQLLRIAISQGRVDEADALVEEALVATNNNPNILWAQASRLERKGDIDGAIAIYEDLYVRNSGSLIIANNLASLLATYKQDDESLERAWVVGRRLKNADNPALQDTYGWLLYRRGEVEEAVPYLESAAEGLKDPIVQAHLGFAYAALGRNEEALAQMQRAAEMAGPADTRERIEMARAEIIRLSNLPEN